MLGLCSFHVNDGGIYIHTPAHSPCVNRVPAISTVWRTVSLGVCTPARWPGTRDAHQRHSQPHCVSSRRTTTAPCYLTGRGRLASERERAVNSELSRPPRMWARRVRMRAEMETSRLESMQRVVAFCASLLFSFQVANMRTAITLVCDGNGLGTVCL